MPADLVVQTNAKPGWIRDRLRTLLGHGGNHVERVATDPNRVWVTIGNGCCFSFTPGDLSAVVRTARFLQSIAIDGQLTYYPDGYRSWVPLYPLEIGVEDLFGNMHGMGCNPNHCYSIHRPFNLPFLRQEFVTGATKHSSSEEEWLASDNASREFSVYIQTGSFKKDASVLTLLDLVAHAFLPREWTAQIQDGMGNTKLAAPSCLSRSRRIGNQLFASFQFQPIPLPGPGTMVLGVESLLTLAPTNALWESCWRAKAGRGDDSESRRRAAYGARERYLKQNLVKSFPTIFEIGIRVLGPPKEKSSATEFIAKKLLAGLSKLHEGVIAYCFADINYSLPFVDLIDELLPWPHAYCEIGERIEHIHQIMLVKQETAERFLQRRPKTKIIGQLHAGERNDLAQMLALSPLRQPERLENELVDIFVRKNKKTAYCRFTSEEGEHPVQFNLYYEYVRYRDLLNREALPPLPSGYVYFRVVPKRFLSKEALENGTWWVGSNKKADMRETRRVMYATLATNAPLGGMHERLLDAVTKGLYAVDPSLPDYRMEQLDAMVGDSVPAKR